MVERRDGRTLARRGFGQRDRAAPRRGTTGRCAGAVVRRGAVRARVDVRAGRRRRSVADAPRASARRTRGGRGVGQPAPAAGGPTSSPSSRAACRARCARCSSSSGPGPSLQLAFEAAGFAQVPPDRLTTMLHYATRRKRPPTPHLRAAPWHMAYSRFDEPTRVEARAEYIASIEPYRVATGYNIPGEFVVTKGGRVGSGVLGFWVRARHGRVR